MTFDAFAAAGGSPSQVSQGNTPESQSPAPDSGGQTNTPPPAQQQQATPPQKESFATQVAKKAQDLAQNQPSLVQQPTPEAPEWTPNFKFKAYGVEHEMDPYFQQFVKSAEDETKFREVYEKAFGLDVMKPKYQSLQEQFEPLQKYQQSTQSMIQDMQTYYQRGDFEGLFKTLGVSEEKVLQWIVDKAQYNQLPPEQRKAFDGKREADSRVYQLEKQMQEVQRNYEAQVVQAKSHGLQIALEKPDVRQLAQAYDAKKGVPGAFYQEVVNHGQSVWMQTQGKIDLSPEQAVQQVVERLTMFGGPQAPQQHQVIPAQQTQQQGQPAQKSIPNLGSRNAAAVGKPKFRSIEDLKKYAATLES